MPLPAYYYNNDKESFAFSTCRERWPKILQDAIADVNLTAGKCDDSAFAQQGKAIVKGIEALIDDLATDKPLARFSDSDVSSIPGLASFNASLERLSCEGPLTWLAAPWLFTECYLYRRVDALVKAQDNWQAYDIFENLKQKSFKSTAVAVYELAKRVRALYDDTVARKHPDEKVDLVQGKTLFKEFIDVCLWGNKIDLSLLANKSQGDVHSGQSAEARLKAEKNILSNDTDSIWEHLVQINEEKPGSGKRVDFVLDNSGFETFTDLTFALFLVEFKLADQVVIHCKTRPWMVSDTMIKDIDLLLADLVDDSFFSENAADLRFLKDKFEGFIVDGTFKLQDNEFWCIDLDYWNIDPSQTEYYGAELYTDLKRSDLVFVKGDLNYRKLTGDRKWAKTTPFTEAIGPLASNGLKVAALRTCKADVCVGLPEGVNEKLTEKWHAETGEPGEMWSSSGNWAVISFSNGEKKN